MERVGFNAGHLQTRRSVYHIHTHCFQVLKHGSFVNSGCFAMQKGQASMEEVIRVAFLDDSPYTPDSRIILMVFTYPIPHTPISSRCSGTRLAAQVF